MRGSESTRMEKRKRRLDPSLLEYEEGDEEEEDEDDDVEEEEESPKKKQRRPGFFCSEISEACAIKLLQKSIEPAIRKVVREEVDAALWKYSLANATGSSRCSTEQRDRPDQRDLRLQFESGLPTSLFTEANVEAEQGGAIKVALLDASTGSVITLGPESSVKLEAVVLEGDFNNNEDEDWTEEEFESHVVKAREGKRHLLHGNLQVTLKKGVGALGNLSLTDNSSWVRSRKFRIGVKVASGYCVCTRIREAKTNAFTVKDHRGASYKKHHPPALDNDVWRLEKIGKDGKFHDRLKKAGICTVKEFLRHLVRDPKELRNILGSGLSNKMWEDLVNHARTCVLDGKQYVYHHDDSRNVGVIFNDIYELKGLIADGYNYPVESFFDNMKVYVDNLVKEAYDNLGRIMEYVNLKQSTAGIQRTPDGTFDQQRTPTSLPTPITLQPPTMEGGSPPGGISDNGNPTTEHLMHSQYLNSDFHLQYDGSSSSFQNQPMGTSHETKILTNDGMLGLAPVFSHSSIPGLNNGFQSSLSTNSNFNDKWLFLGEENHDPLMMTQGDLYGNDMFPIHYDANVGFPDNFHVIRKETGVSSQQNRIQGEGQIGPSGSSFQQNCRQGEGRVRSSRKAIPRWLKLKAVVLWGICIRKKVAKKAAERLAPVFLF